MAEVTRTGVPSPCSPVPAFENRHPGGKVAGEALIAGDVVYLKTSDSKWWKATGAADNEAADAWGMVPNQCSVGEVAAVYWGCRFNYGPNVTGTASAVGDPLFLSGTVPGGLADAASVGGTKPLAIVFGDGVIQIVNLGMAW